MKKINFAELAHNLKLKDGIWFSKANLSRRKRLDSKISYPQQGNQSCYQIEEKSFWFNHRNNCLIETLKNFPPNGTFYDIGGGNGFVSLGLKNNGIETVLVEPGIEGVLNAKKRGIKHLICSTLEEANFKKQTMPAIGVFDVVEHIENDKKFLTTLKDHLIAEGRLYLTVPAYKFLWSEEDDDAGHFKRYSIKNMSKLLSQIGFNVEYATYIFSILPIPIYLFRTLPTKIGINRKHDNLEKLQNEHNRYNKGLLNGLVEKIWYKELQYIRKRKKIPLGSSCLIVARKYW